MTREDTYPRIDPVGDSALLVQFGDGTDLQHNTAALEFDRQLREQAPQGITETSPAIRSVLIRYDYASIALQALTDYLQQLLAATDWQACPLPEDRKLWRVPVWYSPDSAVDLAKTADLLHCSIDELITSHSSARQRVYTIGFAPGVAYAGPLPDQWDLPRLDYIKPEVPQGAVCVAIRQSVIFSAPMPTGWLMIGQTPLLNFIADREPACLLQAGDEIIYEPVSKSQFQSLQRKQKRRELILTAEQVVS